MRVLKGFSRLEMCLNIQYGMTMESIAFVCNCIQKCSSAFEISAVNLIVG